MMDNCTTCSREQTGLTSGEIWTHLALFYTFLCGVVTSTGNILVLTVIYRTKTLRHPFMISIGALTLCRVLLCFQFFTMGVYRMLRQAKLAPFTMPRISCHSVHIWLVIGLTLELILLLLLVLDRWVALVTISTYRRYTPKRACILCASLFLIGVLIKLPSSYVGVDLIGPVACVNSYSAPNEEFNAYSQHIDLALLVTILILYLLLIVYIKVRPLNDRTGDESTLRALVKEYQLMPDLRNLVFAHCIFAIVSKVMRTLAGVYKEDLKASARFTAYGGLFSTIDLFSNMIALLLLKEDIRRAAVKCFRKKDTVIIIKTGVKIISGGRGTAGWC